jgi:hypothetical protein
MKHFISLPLLVLPISVFADSGLPDKPYIYVEGKAEIQKLPDIVTLRIELVARATELPESEPRCSSSRE